MKGRGAHFPSPFRHTANSVAAPPYAPARFAVFRYPQNGDMNARLPCRLIWRDNFFIIVAARDLEPAFIGVYMKVSELKHSGLKKWVEEAQALMMPDAVEVCDGSAAEYDRMIKITIDSGLATVLDENKRPGSVLYRSDPSDVARVEDRTYIASKNKDDAGPTNNWIDPAELKKTMSALYKGSMKGRVMYVIPFSMGPVGSEIAPTLSQICTSWRV